MEFASKNIGITYLVKENGSIFGSSRGYTALILRKMLESFGANVTLVHCTSEVKWWDDAVGLEGNIISLSDCSGLDLLIDIDATLSGELRKKVAKKTVGFLRGRVLFNELENCAYLQQNIIIRMDNLEEIWFWDVFNPEEDLGALATLYKVPTRRLPFLWDPFVLDNFIKHSGIQEKKFSGKRTFYIAEKNTSNTSSAILPLTGLVEFSKRRESGIFDKIIITNGIQLQDVPFYKTNIIPNLKFSYPVEIEYTDRIRFAHLLEEDNPFVVTHCRYVPFRYSMLDLAYLGIPFVHNSNILNSIGLNGYYKNNSISGMCDAILAFPECERQRPDFSRWLVQSQKAIWETQNFSGLFYSRAEPDFSQSKEPRRAAIRIGFAYMWAGFDPCNNFFIHLLNHYGYTAEGTTELDNIDVLIFGPFNQSNSFDILKELHCPKVYFTGENTQEPEGADLYLTFAPDNDNHIRLPLWMLFLNWFDKEIDAKQNPQTLPVELATQSHPIGYTERSEEFSFVVSNPMNELRNDVFLKLAEKYKINSGGHLFNNIGGPLASMYPGGGGGDRVKHEFLEKHKFNICFENSKGEGYVTEKLLHAKLAGCIPVYWGAPEAVHDFVPEGFINVSECQTADEVDENISGILANVSNLKEMARIPALDAQRLLDARSRLKQIADRIVSLAETKQITETKHIPEPMFISYVTTKYIESVIRNIESNSKLQFRVYLGPDITPEDRVRLLAYRNIKLVEMDTYFEPKSFGWKIYILQKVVNEPELKDKLIIYTDAGAQWIHLPEELLRTAYTKGLCFLLDPENNTNEQWCSKEMKEEYKLTEEELDARQILAGFQVFRAGHELPIRVYNEALHAASNSKILEGQKYISVLPDGRLHGHRHDQSIFSTLRIRYNVPSLPANRIVNEKSLRLTELTKNSIYLHRGDYKKHIQPLPNVDDIWIINLERRKDRLESLYEAMPFLNKNANVFNAVDGKELQMTPTISKLIEGNDFINKKSVTAVALSHIMLWTQLVAEKDDINSYLILEDDVRFAQVDLENIMKAAPEDAELLYLGGILPNNRSIYKNCIEQVGDIWATIKENEYFTPGRPSSVFHFCAYSYIITKSGAKKLLAALEQIGCFTSIDHFMGHPMFGLKKYVLQDLVATCFQESDPNYINAEFDNFKRIDSFDSDIWNNIECWSEEDLEYKVTSRPSIEQLKLDILYQVNSNQITKSIFDWNGYKPRNLYYKKSYNKTILDKLAELDLHFNLVEYSDAIAAADEKPLFLIDNLNDWIKTLDTYTQADIPFSILYPGSADIHYKNVIRLDSNFQENCENIPILEDNILVIKTALEKNTVPFYIRTKGDDSYWKWLRSTFNFVELTSDAMRDKLLEYFKKNPVALDTYMNGLKKNMKKWITKLHIRLYN